MRIDKLSEMGLYDLLGLIQQCKSANAAFWCYFDEHSSPLPNQDGMLELATNTERLIDAEATLLKQTLEAANKFIDAIERYVMEEQE